MSGLESGTLAGVYGSRSLEKEEMCCLLKNLLCVAIFRVPAVCGKDLAAVPYSGGLRRRLPVSSLLLHRAQCKMMSSAWVCLTSLSFD